MATLKDEELLFLSNLMHMKQEHIVNKNGIIEKSPFDNIWTKQKAEANPTIESIISKIDISKLRKEPWCNYKFDGEISGSEWADMIEAMKQSSICELTLRDVKIDEKKALSAYFTDSKGNAYVVFRGTAAGEWGDNFDGAHLTDTVQQQRALDYINSIDAEHITVVGHSKGGNKAKYVALLSDKVDRCVAFDSQGFSREFMDKYEDLIKKNKHKITCYALDSDFVNILLYDIYDKKYYIKGNGVSGFAENHSPNSFFQFSRDKRGRITFEFKKGKQSESMAKLHLFVSYVDSTATEQERKKIFSFVGNIVAMLLGRKPPHYTEKYSTDELLEYIIAPENSEELSLLLAYILEFEEYNGVLTHTLLEILGFDILAEAVHKLKIEATIEKLLERDNRDKIIKILNLFKAYQWSEFVENLGNSYDKAKFRVKRPSPERTADYNPESNNYLRDYSPAIRDMLLELTSEVANEKPYDVTKWDIWYRFEDWIGLLDIDHYKNNIEKYFRKVIDINDISYRQMKQIFDDVDTEVNNYKIKMENIIFDLKGLSTQIKNLY